MRHQTITALMGSAVVASARCCRYADVIALMNDLQHKSGGAALSCFPIEHQLCLKSSPNLIQDL